MSFRLKFPMEKPRKKRLSGRVAMGKHQQKCNSSSSSSRCGVETKKPSQKVILSSDVAMTQDGRCGVFAARKSVHIRTCTPISPIRLSGNDKLEHGPWAPDKMGFGYALLRPHAAQRAGPFLVGEGRHGGHPYDNGGGWASVLNAHQSRII